MDSWMPRQACFQPAFGIERTVAANFRIGRFCVACDFQWMNEERAKGNMDKCLVTGGAGFIGSHLVDALVAGGRKVRVLDDLSTGRLDNFRHVRDRIEWIEGSITDMKAVEAATNGVQWVFHLAALPSVQRSVED